LDQDEFIVLPELKGVTVPARVAYSHSASLGKRYTLPVFALSHLVYALASFWPMLTTGRATTPTFVFWPIAVATSTGNTRIPLFKRHSIFSNREGLAHKIPANGSLLADRQAHHELTGRQHHHLRTHCTVAEGFAYPLAVGFGLTRAQHRRDHLLVLSVVWQRCV